MLHISLITVDKLSRICAEIFHYRILDRILELQSHESPVYIYKSLVCCLLWWVDYGSWMIDRLSCWTSITGYYGVFEMDSIFILPSYLVHN